MSPPHTPTKPKRYERDTIKRARFHDVLKNQKNGQSFNEICRRKGIEISFSTDRLWRRQFEEQGDTALRRTRRQSSRLERQPKISNTDLQPLLEPQHPLHIVSFEIISQTEEIDIDSRQLHIRYKRLGARRYKRQTSSKISDKNRTTRIKYGEDNGCLQRGAITQF
jgi:hypothetical protein